MPTSRFSGRTSSPANRKPTDAEVDGYGLTHQGLIRKSNQDHFLIASLRKSMDVHRTSLPDPKILPTKGERIAWLAMVADGVGGGTGGEVASRLAVQAVTGYVAHSMEAYYSADARDQSFLEELQEAAMECHAELLEQAEKDPDLTGMATTLTLWLGVWPRAYLLQVGDSRFYLLRNGHLNQISRDQTMAQELTDLGILERTEARNSRWNHILSSAIGGRQAAPVVARVEQNWGDVGLLCSDGLTKHVSDDQIRERLMNMTSAREACEQLLQDALDGGGSDNITILVGRTVKHEE